MLSSDTNTISFFTSSNFGSDSPSSMSASCAGRFFPCFLPLVLFTNSLASFFSLACCQAVWLFGFRLHSAASLACSAWRWSGSMKGIGVIRSRGRALCSRCPLCKEWVFTTYASNGLCSIVDSVSSLLSLSCLHGVHLTSVHFAVAQSCWTLNRNWMCYWSVIHRFNNGIDWLTFVCTMRWEPPSPSKGCDRIGMPETGWRDVLRLNTSSTAIAPPAEVADCAVISTICPYMLLPEFYLSSVSEMAEWCL